MTTSLPHATACLFLLERKRRGRNHSENRVLHRPGTTLHLRDQWFRTRRNRNKNIQSLIALLSLLLLVFFCCCCFICPPNVVHCSPFQLGHQHGHSPNYYAFEEPLQPAAVNDKASGVHLRAARERRACSFCTLTSLRARCRGGSSCVCSNLAGSKLFFGATHMRSLEGSAG